MQHAALMQRLSRRCGTGLAMPHQLSANPGLMLNRRQRQRRAALATTQQASSSTASSAGATTPQFGAASMQGPREAMEDELCLEPCSKDGFTYAGAQPLCR
jgi:hypothetical protein